MLDYHNRLIAIDLSRQKQLDPNSNAIQWKKTRWTIKKLCGSNNAVDGDSPKSWFVLTIFEKIKETRLKFSQKNVTIFKKMAIYEKVRVQLTNDQSERLYSIAKSKTGTTLTKKHH